MHNLMPNSQANPDHQRANGVEDSPLLTIEYLRASLLAERSVSKAAKERVDKLAKRVKDLEEQLKIVSIQRKRAEKATLDVLSYLESRGVSDVSEVYESDCDEDVFLYESNVHKSREDDNFEVYESDCDEDELLYESNVHKSREDDNFGFKASKGSVKELSDSEHESTPSSSGSLSWNGRKKISQLLRKRNLDSFIQRRTDFPLVNPSPRHHLGKSCRQVKRRERSAVEESRHDSVKSDIQGSNTSDHHANILDIRGDQSENTPERLFERCFRKEEASLSFRGEAQDVDARSSSQGHECNGEMERALKHQAQLRDLYKAQEKAQRNWEEKYKDDQVRTVDSREPGYHSDVTEERDENKATIPDFGNVAPCHDNGQKAITDTHFQGKSSINYSDSFKLTPCADTGCSEDEKKNAMQSSTSPAPDFVFPTVSSNHTQKLEEGNSSHEVHFSALSSDNTLCVSHYANLDGQHALVPREGLQWPGEVLNALQGAKVLLNQKLHRLPESGGSAEREIGTSVSAVRDVEWLKIPAACPGLFRVPAVLQSQTSSYSRSLVSHNARQLTDSYLRAGAPYLQDYQHISSPDSRLSALSVDAISSSAAYGTSFGPARPRVEYHSNTHVGSSSKSTFSPYSSFPQ